MTNNDFRARLTGAMVSVALAIPAAAQQSMGANNSADSSTASPTDALQEIVVTAEKRSANIMTTAAAINALSGDALKDREVTDLEGLTTSTPSFTYENQGPTSAVNIRGIGLSISSPNVAPGVPLYRDGLLAPTLLPNEPFVDIGDVEVLRGPQGTLVGSNSTGGAVFINTRNPELASTNGYVEAEAGSYSRLGVQAAYNVPVNDTVAVRGAFYYERRDSYWTDLEPTSNDHRPPGAVGQLVARIGVLYEPNDQLSVLFKTNFQNDQNGGMAHTPLAGTNAAVGYPTSHYVLSYQDPDTEYSDYQIRSSLEIKYKFADGVALRSVSGVFYTYEYYDDQEYVDPTTTTVASAPFINRINDHVYSQEFNVLSPEGSALHWVGGTFSQFWPAHIDLNPNTVPARFITVYEGTTKASNAAFGEVGYDITPEWEVHVGARETFDHAYGNGGVYIPSFGNLEVQSNQVGQTDNLFTGRVGVNWKATPDQFAYAFAAKGAKTGGINASGEPNFAPETVYDYEGGLKSTWAEGHLRTQVGAFYMHYNNLQLAVESPAPGQPPTQIIANAGKSTVKGAELSMQSQFNGLQIDGNLSYVDSSVSSPPLLNSYSYEAQGYSPMGLQCAPGQTAGCFNYTPYYQSANGVSNPFSPKWTGNVGASYAIAMPLSATLTPRADFSYSSIQWATIFQNPVDRFQERRILNLNVSYALKDWKITAYGTNVTRDYYITGQTGAQNFWGAPAEYGLRVTKTL